MTGRYFITRKLGAIAMSGVLGATAAMACSSGGVDSHEEATEVEPTPLQARDESPVLPTRPALEVVAEIAKSNPVLVERFMPAPELRLRRHGHRLLPQLAKDKDTPAATLGLELGGTSSQRLVLHPIENPEQFVALAPLRSRDVEAEVQADGRIVYRNAFTGTDWIVTANHNRIAHTLVLHSASSPADFRWRLEVAKGLKPVESSRNEVSWVNAQGHLRLTLREVSITSADGSISHTQLALGTDGMASLMLDPRTLSYPAVVQFEIEAPPIALAIIPPEIIKARMMVLVDTSASMIYQFTSDSSAGGDSPAGGDIAAFCDNQIGTSFDCNDNVQCSVANGGRNFFPVSNNNNPSRMLATKLAMLNVINAHSGLIDFGLARYRENPSQCSNNTYCCNTVTGTTTRGRCTDGAITLYPRPPISGSDFTFAGVGGDFFSCTGLTAGAGGRVLEVPGASSATNVRQWFDFVEDFCSSTGSAGGRPRNPELRADGLTPLAWSIDSVRTDWYTPAYNAWNNNTTGHALYDDKFDCRPYVLTVLTDGDDTCVAQNQQNTEPPAAVTRLRNVSPVNPITIYTMGMGDTGGVNPTVLNSMMNNGGSGRTTAPIAQNQSDIEAAFADIVAETVKFEVCNAADDNCNGRIDEGLNVYQECAANADCGSNDCDAGRCACTADSQCASGYTCAADNFCRPACTVGTSVCRNSGVRKCGSTGGQCCVDDGSATCTPLSPLPPGIEVCNRIDDDCDGLIDEDFPLGCPQCIPRPEVCNGEDDDCDGLVDNDDTDLVGVGAPCGTDEGVCTSGTINCVDGEPVCEGEAGGDDEVCNGLDDDCNGKVDGQTQACYTGPSGTLDVGICHGGTQVCVAPAGQPGVPCSGDDCWGPCVGEVTPTIEICDGLDNDCDSETDEGVPAGVQPCEDHGDCLGSNNCINNACQCNAGSCSDGFVCGGDNICHPPSPVTGDQCCNENFDDKCGTGVCTYGEWTCSGNQVSCQGGTGPSDEICDGLDNDCDGETDEDLPGVGDACETDGGECGGVLVCDPEAGAIVCQPTDGGTPEICDGLDNDCDGQIDELPDIAENDPTGMLDTECNAPPDGMSQGACQPGIWECIDGILSCEGDVQPGTEVCNGQDDDCDGEVDEDTCPDGECIDGACRYRCRSGEFPCPPGEVCRNGFCVTDQASSNASGNNASGNNTSGSNAGSTNGSGGSSSSAGGSGGSSSGSGGEPGSGGTTGAGGSSSTTQSAAGGTSANVSGPTTGGDDIDRVYGLPSGGGGCACRLADTRPTSQLALLLGLALAGGAFGRRRVSRARLGQ